MQISKLKWVARATRPSPWATGPTEWGGALISYDGCILFVNLTHSGRRVADRDGQVARSTHFGCPADFGIRFRRFPTCVAGAALKCAVLQI